MCPSLPPHHPRKMEFRYHLRWHVISGLIFKPLCLFFEKRKNLNSGATYKLIMDFPYGIMCMYKRAHLPLHELEHSLEKHLHLCALNSPAWYLSGGGRMVLVYNRNIWNIKKCCFCSFYVLNNSLFALVFFFLAELTGIFTDYYSASMCRIVDGAIKILPMGWCVDVRLQATTSLTA